MKVDITAAEILHRANGLDTISLRIDLGDSSGRQKYFEVDFECPHGQAEKFIADHLLGVPVRSVITIGGL